MELLAAAERAATRDDDFCTGELRALAFRRFYAWISKRAAKRAAVGLETAKDTP